MVVCVFEFVLVRVVNLTWFPRKAWGGPGVVEISTPKPRIMKLGIPQSNRQPYVKKINVVLDVFLFALLSSTQFKGA